MKSFGYVKVQTARGGVEIARKHKRKESAQRSSPSPRLQMDLGLSKCLRGVGLIQVHQTLDLKAEITWRMVSLSRHTKKLNQDHTRSQAGQSMAVKAREQERMVHARAWNHEASI
jgi:hypothetical protein